MARVMLVYPNLYEPWLPMGISHLSSALKASGHDVKLFDATKYNLYNKINSIDMSLQDSMRKNYIYKPHKRWYEKIDISLEDFGDTFINSVNSYKPDVIGMSVMTHDVFPLTSYMLKKLEEYNGMVVVGGVVPTITPEWFDRSRADIVFRGEGEAMFPSICDDPDKYSGGVIDGTTTEINDLVLPDWDIFDDMYFYWPFGKNVYRFGRFDRTRGCPNRCQYCVYSSDTYPESMKKVRSKTNDRMISELVTYKDKYSLEFVTFNDDNFLCGNTEENEEFLNMYKIEVNLPYIISAHASTINSKTARALSKSGCAHVSIGVESGSSRIRKEILKRTTRDHDIVNAFHLLRDNKIHTSSLNMIGLPGETEDDFKDTLELNYRCKPDKGMCFYFYPYRGTPLGEYSVDNGLVSSNAPQVNFGSSSVMPGFNNMKMYHDTFNVMIRYPPSIRYSIGKLCYKYDSMMKFFSKINSDKY